MDDGGRRDESTTVTVGEAVVVLTRSGTSQPTVANILGQEADAHGPWHVVLDRLVHHPGEREFVGWTVCGAVSSELRRVVPPFLATVDVQDGPAAAAA
jgi:hypothetical protein